MRTNTEQQATVSSRAIVSDDGSTIWLTTYGQDGAVLRVQLSPLRTLGLAGDLLRAAIPKVGDVSQTCAIRARQNESSGMRLYAICTS
jgi:hypothetical protein